MDWLNGFFDFALPMFDNVPAVRAILGALLVFFLPGFAWTLVFFKQLQNIERVALSFGLSIAFVTLSIIFTNIVLKIKIDGIDSLLTIIIITLIPLAIYCAGKYRSRKKNVPVKN